MTVCESAIAGPRLSVENVQLGDVARCRGRIGQYRRARGERRRANDQVVAVRPSRLPRFAHWEPVCHVLVSWRVQMMNGPPEVGSGGPVTPWTYGTAPATELRTDAMSPPSSV